MKTLAFSKLSITALLACAQGCASSSSAPAHEFQTPEAAVRGLVEASEDEDAAEALLGPGGFSLLRSGDDVADRQDFEAVVALVQEGVAFEDIDADRKLALLGRERWELPIPLVREGDVWKFDVEAGREEVLNRRVGRNELSTIATLREFVAAQREYAAEQHDQTPVQYAQRVLSSPGKHDGLYWDVAQGQPESPLGPFVAEAFEEGYRESAEKPIPYHGYCFRLLTEQGSNAPGGVRSYLDEKGRLTRGFAFVAWPATYDNSGVMTFVVNQQGIVFQKDFGPVENVTVTSYDPDASWTPTSD
jgi:hypothetical protein